QDFSRVVEVLDALRAQGITDIAAHMRDSPDFRQQVTDSIRTVELNQAAADMLSAPRREDALGPITPFLPADEPMLVDVLQARQAGKPSFEGQGRLRAMDGNDRVFIISMVFPADPASSTCVVGALVDITERERTQQALLAAQAELARASRAATVGVLSASIA